MTATDKLAWVVCSRNAKYRVNRDGEVLGAFGRVLKQGLNRGGYRTVNLGFNNPQRVHTLVAEAFLGPKPDGMCVAHLDGNPLNNRVENLKYCTTAENMSHKQIHGTQDRGEAHHQSRLTEEQARQILADRRSTVSVAREFGVSWSTVYDIRKGNTWKHLEAAS